jgi:hypothetical protein
MKRLVLLGAALLGAVGCQGSGSRIPADPLFVSRKPIESRAAYSPVARASYREVAPPAAEEALTVRASGATTEVASAH